MRGGAIHDRTSFVILCNASMKRNGQPATTDTLPYTYIILSGRKAKINLHTTPKFTVAMPIGSAVSCHARIQEFSSGGGGGGGGHINLTK